MGTLSPHREVRCTFWQQNTAQLIWKDAPHGNGQETGSGESIPVGIDVSDAPKLNEYYYYVDKEPVFSFIINSDKTENDIICRYRSHCFLKVYIRIKFDTIFGIAHAGINISILLGSVNSHIINKPVNQFGV